MRCSFLSRDVPCIVPGISYDHPHLEVSDAAATVVSQPSIPSNTPHTSSGEQAAHPYHVNITHMELFSNTFTEDFLSLQNGGHPDILPDNMIRRYTLVTPYLMHELLAMSAFHLSIRLPESRQHYRELATGLRNRALVIFNECSQLTDITLANCVPVFIFSSAVGIHLLCDTLHYARGSLDELIDQFTQCLGTIRGVTAVVEQCRHLLRQTEMDAHLNIASELMQATYTGKSECSALWSMVNNPSLDTSYTTAYREAIAPLERLFNAQRAAAGDKTRAPTGLVWPILVSPAYVESLRQRKREALVILAYYGVLLHRGRNLWIFGSSGRFLIESICARLDVGAEEWLEVPKGALRGDKLI